MKKQGAYSWIAFSPFSALISPGSTTSGQCRFNALEAEAHQPVAMLDQDNADIGITEQLDQALPMAVHSGADLLDGPDDRQPFAQSKFGQPSRLPVQIRFLIGAGHARVEGDAVRLRRLRMRDHGSGRQLLGRDGQTLFLPHPPSRLAANALPLGPDTQLHPDILLHYTYSDRLEIQSPGRLPNAVTLEGIKAGIRYARNRTLVNVMRDYRYVDFRGMGVRDKIIPGMRAHNGTEPEFIAKESRLTVRLWKEAKRS